MGIGKRLIITLACILLVGLGLSTFGAYQEARQSAVNAILHQAESIRATISATWHVYQKQFLNSDIQLTDKTIGFLPAYALSRISTDFGNWDKSGIYFNNVSDRPRNPNNKANPQEMKAIKFFRKNKDQSLFFRTYENGDGDTFYLYAKPIWIESNCLQCHGKKEDAPLAIQANYTTAFDYKVGDLRGILSINLPAGKVEAAVMEDFYIKGMTHLVIVGSVFLVIWLTITKYVTTPLRQLDTGIRKIARGDFEGQLSGFSGELAVIEDSFNLMAKERKKAEDMVQKRTMELTSEIVKHQLAESRLIEVTAQADMANKAKSEFLAAISHDLRTPLTAIMGFSDMMKAETFGPLGDSHYRQYVEDIHDSGSMLVLLINDILDLSKIESGKYVLKEQALDISVLVKASFRQLITMADASSQTLSADIPSEIPGLCGDGKTVIQILNNLISNAIKFTPNSGFINVTARVDDHNAIVVSITDTGIGMSREGIIKVLQPFEQADAHRPRKYQGTGLGLHLCVNFMKLFGGTLDVQSEVNKGTTITLRFPPERTITAL